MVITEQQAEESAPEVRYVPGPRGLEILNAAGVKMSKTPFLRWPAQRADSEHQSREALLRTRRHRGSDGETKLIEQKKPPKATTPKATFSERNHIEYSTITPF